MLAARRIETTDSERRRKTAKFMARLLNTLSWIIGLIAATVVFVLLLIVPPGFTVGEWALALIGTMVVGGLLLIVINRYKKRFLEKAGCGIRALSYCGATVEANTAVFTLPDRKVVVDTVWVSGAIASKYADRLSGAACTRVRVEHRGELPCVLQLPLQERKPATYVDKDVYNKWIKSQPRKQFLLIPKKVEIDGQEVAVALPSEMVPKVAERARRIFDVPKLASLKGVVTIEPEQVVWLRPGDMLPQELLENAVNIMAEVAHRIEVEYVVFSLGGWKKSSKEEVYA
jgi:hypothetical protein